MFRQTFQAIISTNFFYTLKCLVHSNMSECEILTKRHVMYVNNAIVLAGRVFVRNFNAIIPILTVFKQTHLSLCSLLIINRVCVGVFRAFGTQVARQRAHSGSRKCIMCIPLNVRADGERSWNVSMLHERTERVNQMHTRNSLYILLTHRLGEFRGGLLGGTGVVVCFFVVVVVDLLKYVAWQFNLDGQFLAAGSDASYCHKSGRFNFMISSCFISVTWVERLRDFRPGEFVKRVFRTGGVFVSFRFVSSRRKSHILIASIFQAGFTLWNFLRFRLVCSTTNPRITHAAILIR